MRAVFMGTPDFAVPSLEVIAENYHLVGVVTQPDRKRSRGHKVTYSPVKKQALTYDVPVYQPDTINTKEFYNELVALKPQVIVIVAFGQKIPKQILSLPPKGCINVHASLLPKYRGAAPIHYAIINGEQTTGVTTMYLDQGWDDGDMILTAKVSISPEDTAQSLHDRLALLGAQLLKQTLDLVAEDKAPRIAQDDRQASYAHKLTKDDGKIDWKKSASDLHNFIRGMNPWPGAYTFFNQELIKIWQAKIGVDHGGKPGMILEINKAGILVATGSGSLWLDKLQRPGTRVMDAFDLANGLRLQAGYCLGDCNEG